MEKDKNFSEENAFLVEGGQISEDNGTDLVPFLEYTVEEKMREKGGIPLPLRLGLIFVAFAVVLFCVTVFFAPNKSIEYIDVESAPTQTEEWRGAFLDRSIYESCASCSVSVRAGRESLFSGVILREDGWIVTSSEIIDGVSGRIYVSLNDGREYEVDSFKMSDGLALLKISAKELSAAELCLRELHSGEAMIALSGEGDVLNCSVSNLSSERIKVDIGAGEGYSGAPLFDENGELAAILGKTDENGRITYAIAIKSLKKAAFE